MGLLLTLVLFSPLPDLRPYMAEMMTDPFGNYLFQKILDKSIESQRSAILSYVKDDLVEGALNLHGTRSVQRILEVCKTPDQLEIITAALRHDVVRLCVDANGNHVIQRALQHLAPEDRAFIFEAVSQVSKLLQGLTQRIDHARLTTCVLSRLPYHSGMFGSLNPSSWMLCRPTLPRCRHPRTT